MSLNKFTVAKLNNPSHIVGGTDGSNSGAGGGQTDKKAKSSVLCGVTITN